MACRRCAPPWSGDNNEKTANFAKIFVTLAPSEARELSQGEVMAVERRDILPSQPKDTRIDVSPVPTFAGGGTFTAIQYEISGPDLKALERYGATLVERAKKIPGATDIDSTFVTGKPEVSLRIDRAKAADLGVRVSDVADTLRLFVSGLEVSTYEENGQTYDVFLRGSSEYRGNVEGLALSRCRRPSSARCPCSTWSRRRRARDLPRSAA